MRAFIILCFIVAACADKLGYNYQPVPHSPSGLSFVPGTGATDGGPSGASFDLGSIDSQAIGIGAPGVGGGGIGAAAPGFGNIGGNVASDNTPSHNAPAELEKEYYTFSAPESEFDDANAIERVAGSIKHGLRVIFIKGPENNALEKATITLAKQALEQKTAIYVLNKQTDLGDLSHKLNAINKQYNSKPEVHFIKYRTPEDAVNAQKAIQEQYDSLGGTSQAHDGGVAPVLNFASQAPVRTVPSQAPRNSYLPSSIFRS